MLKRLTFAVIILLFACAFAQQDTTFAGTIPQLEGLIPQLMDRYRVIGLSVGMVQEGSVIYTGAFGLKNAANQSPMTVDTVFNAASIGKALTAWGMLRRSGVF